MSKQAKYNHSHDFIKIACIAGLTGADLPPLKATPQITRKQLKSILINSRYSKDELMNIVNELK